MKEPSNAPVRVNTASGVEVDVPPQRELSNFFSNLETLGVFPRAYDTSCLDLYLLTALLHKHLCKLDNGYYQQARGVKLYELANIYAETQKGLRQLE